MQKNSRVVLASGSARRKELLKKIVATYEVVASDIPEEILPGESAEAAVVRLAEAKARAVAVQIADIHATIIGADSLVFLGGKILGKPRDRDEAKEFLSALSGQTHGCTTGLCILRGEKCETAVVTTWVTFRVLSADEIATYVAEYPVTEFAGGYGYQTVAREFVNEIQGDAETIVGLPTKTVANILKNFT